LAARVVTAGDPDPVGTLDAVGHATRATVLSLLPVGWSWEGRRVLDFGSGPGTSLRHFMAEAQCAGFFGCDIHAPSIAWVEEHLSPPVRAFVNGEAPPLPLPDGSVDLVLAVSVFGHITDQWSAWLRELHRVLADDGLMIATIMSTGMSVPVAGEAWSEEHVGMNTFNYGAGFDDASQGPMVLHSPWWIRSHWGRIFDVAEIIDDARPGRHAVVKLLKRPGRVSLEELERPDPAEPREVTAMRHQIRQMQHELAALREEPAGCSNPARSRRARAST
jgi:SAM-dependent methyltransferase